MAYLTVLLFQTLVGLPDALPETASRRKGPLKNNFTF